MGRFIYGTGGSSFEIDDRALSHLRVVMMNKLRRSESFMFELNMSDGSGRRSFWISPAVPIQFHFHGSRAPVLQHPVADRRSPDLGLRIQPLDHAGTSFSYGRSVSRQDHGRRTRPSHVGIGCRDPWIERPARLKAC